VTPCAPAQSNDIHVIVYLDENPEDRVKLIKKEWQPRQYDR
jgi:hypothetical protein